MSFFNLFNIIYIPIFEVVIILCQGKLYQYFRVSIIISNLINSNIIKSLALLYYILGITIEFFPNFFNPIFKVYINNVPKK